MPSTTHGATVAGQSRRILSIQTSLGDDAAVLTELDGEDAISSPFVLRIRFATGKSVEDVKGLLGTAVRLQVGQPDTTVAADARRPFHGFIRRVARGPAAPHDEGIDHWDAEVVPRLWFLSQTSDFRIFQDMTIPEIVKKVLDDHGMSGHYAFRPATLAGYGKLEYCVQYGETALDFVSRLMEQAGIFYWHEHSATDHTLVISDSNSHASDPRFEAMTRIAGGGLTRFEEEFSFRTGKWSVRDFNLLDPSQPIGDSEEWADSIVKSPPSVGNEMRKRERISYPARYMARMHASTHDFGGSASLVSSTDADVMARLLMQLEEAGWHRGRGEGLFAGLNAGMKVSIIPPSQTSALAYLVTSVRHRAQDYSHWTASDWGTAAPAAPSYANSFTCIPHAIQFRPERRTPRPCVQGPQTALVVGPEGSEIHTDKYGRVKLRFPWDRAREQPSPPARDATSCWVRVSQGWAGAGWGQMHIPRVGQEVIVDFLEGDPDRPVVTGRVYNYASTVPYELPASKTKSGIRTRSSPGGSAETYNELSFDDAIGSEQVLLHAEKDYVVEVENNETRTIGMGSKTGDRTTAIKRHETTTIGGNHTETIRGTETRSVTGDVTETFSANETRTITGNQTETVTGTVTQTVTGAINITSSNSVNITAPSLNVVVPDWFITGAKTGSAYGMTAYFAGLAIAGNGLAINLLGLGINVTAMSMNATGLSMNATGLSLSATRVNMAYDAVQLTDCGIEADSVGVALKRGLWIKS